jgi:hypothetical protein
MKEAPYRRRIVVTSSLINEISTDPTLGYWQGNVIPNAPHSFKQQASGKIFEDNVNVFSSISHTFLS